MADATHPVTLRFSHAQALMPVAAWLGHRRGPARAREPGEPYTYENSPWRSATRLAHGGERPVGRAVRNEEGTDPGADAAHQEGEVAFAAGCRPWREGSFFVEVVELRRCYRL
jgi:hypothetical protein